MTADAVAPFDPLAWLGEELAALDAKGLRRRRRTITPLPGGRCVVNGRELFNYATNDYLGLAGHPQLVAAAREALAATGAGSRASALVTGRTAWHAQLEERIAHFEGTEAALVFPTGYAANLGTISALVGQGDVVCGDRLNHASLIDGCRLSGATFRVYPHANADRLDRELEKHRQARRRLIVSDGLFSMDGDCAPLGDLCDAAERHHAMLLVDEAHGTGVLGPSGAGAVEAAGVKHRVPVRVGTLSKAIGSQGGFVAGSHELIAWLVNRARAQIYSTALAPPACAAAAAAIDLIRSEPDRRERLLAHAASLRSRLADHGVPVDKASIGPIVPLIVGDASVTMSRAALLEEQGFLVAAIRPPTVPRGTSRLRISLTAAHSESDVVELADAVADVWEKTRPDRRSAADGNAS